VYILIDNYDSFTYNIYQYLREITDREVRVIRNDAVTPAEVRALAPEAVFISPGPGRPEDAGISVDLIRECAESIPILGICLGHQALAYAFGGGVFRAERIVHGKAEEIFHDGRGVFRAIPSPSVFTRYHSLIVDEETLPPEFEITARSADGEIMGIRHREYLLEGVQFHPESVASETGMKLLRNFINYKRTSFQYRSSLEHLLTGENMSRRDAKSFMEELTEGNLSPPQIAGYLAAFNAKGITSEEIAGCAEVLLEKRLPLSVSEPLLDTCGTGGDGLGTFNISSLAAIAASAAGVKVAKHGNRAVSSRSGSADFFRALRIPVGLGPEAAARMIEDTGFAFLFAPTYHGAMRFAAEARRELGIRTLMNLLGPLVNPAEAEFRLIGVFDERYCLVLAEAAKLLGVRRVMTVHGRDGLDEISVSAPTRSVFIDEDGRVEDRLITPADFRSPGSGVGYADAGGLSGGGVSERDIPPDTGTLAGGSGEENAAEAVRLMEGGGNPVVREAVLVNTAAALFVRGAAGDLRGGYEIVQALFDSGKVLEKYRELASYPHDGTVVGEGPKGPSPRDSGGGE
jgi:anthranilate synthase/phosphoribosyltransferase